MKRCCAIDKLEEPFRSSVVWLIHLMEQEELPFKLFETWRSDETQEDYYTRRVTRARAGESPHNYGLAADFVLDEKKIELPLREWQGRMVHDAWDTTTRSSMEAWGAFGNLAERIGLAWGGRWHFKDLPHVELVEWRDRVTLRK